MGATCWFYYRPYDSSVERAFIELQAHARIHGESPTRSILAMQRVLESTPPTPDYSTEASLRAMQAILAGMPPPEQYGTVYRMTDDELRTSFGTLRPSPSQVEQLLNDGMLELAVERESARYTVLYEDDVPVALFFVGVSGD